VCCEDDDFVRCGRPHAFPEAFLKFMIIFGSSCQVTHPPHRAPPLSLHDCFALFTHCTHRHREREREREWYNLLPWRCHNAKNSDCRQQSELGLLILWNLGSSDTNSIVCKKCWKFQKIPFSMNQNLWRRLENHPSEYWFFKNFDLESSKLINSLFNGHVLNLPMHCNIGHPCV
jgi:hypothetical protein